MEKYCIYQFSATLLPQEFWYHYLRRIIANLSYCICVDMARLYLGGTNVFYYRLIDYSIFFSSWKSNCETLNVKHPSNGFLLLWYFFHRGKLPHNFVANYRSCLKWAYKVHCSQSKFYEKLFSAWCSLHALYIHNQLQSLGNHWQRLTDLEFTWKVNIFNALHYNGLLTFSTIIIDVIIRCWKPRDLDARAHIIQPIKQRKSEKKKLRK